MSEIEKLDIYKVGIMTGVGYVEAPSARAAAMFYGLHGTRGNAQLMVAVYERNGKPVDGDDGLPWGQFQFSPDEAALERELDAVKPELERCRLIPSPKALETARMFLGSVDRDILESWAWKVDNIQEDNGDE